MGETRRPGGQHADARRLPAALVARARLFAALGEPVRLAIVEHLVLGDASPSELGTLVGLPSNLIAHHIKTLEEAGLTRRVRSEGDGRRSYVQLCLDDPDVAALLDSALGRDEDDMSADEVDRAGRRRLSGVRRVVFVCTHNSARSQLAAAAWSMLSELPSTSAGTHPADQVHPRAMRTARRHGMPLDGGDTRDIVATARPDDLLVAVCDNAYEELVPTADGRPTPDLHWSVPDPARLDTDAAFDAAHTDLNRRVTRLATRLADRRAT